MKKTYGVILTNIGMSKGYGRLYIRFYDRNDIGQIPYINSLYLDINNYKDKSRFNYEELIKEHGVFISFSNMVKNYEFSKKEFRIMYKIIKAFCNNSYYKFQFNIKDTNIEYIIVGYEITQIKKSKNRFSSTKLNIYNLKNLLDFFSFQFYIKRKKYDYSYRVRSNQINKNHKVKENKCL